MTPARSPRWPFFAAAVFAALIAGGCTRNVGDAIVLEKEHIDAAEPSPTPTPGPSVSEIPATTQATASATPETFQEELAPDEIAVDTYVMKKNVRGTGKDPRAQTHEQWLIRVEMVKDLLRFTIHSDRAHFLKVKKGDRVRVSYKQGDYTGTVWSARIDD